ncbi:DUF4395 family protein [Micromonospora sp. NPDC005203]|uniref:DUF4395 family protein n=1 Tax=Micromonospora sp. NPDC005203 TaxID=3364226 RepID=UPI0036C20408
MLTLTAAVLAIGFGSHLAAYLVLGAVLVAAALESVFAFCVGCAIFAGLRRIGWIPEASAPNATTSGAACRRTDNRAAACSSLPVAASPPGSPQARSGAQRSW